MRPGSKDHDIFFTIVIPTRERSDTLMSTIQTALSQRYANFQVLVSDNASTDDTFKKVNSISDTRLKYVNTGRRVSMSENWEFALSHVDKGWVTVLGDDDAILPGALERANQIAKETKTEFIRSNGCSYRWPGLNESPFGSLTVDLRRGYETRSSEYMLQRVLDGDRHYNELPMLYNGGFCSADLINRAKAVTKSFFMSMTPDVYSAIVFSLLTESYVYCNEPLAINGASIHSGGTAGFEKKKQQRPYDPAEKFWNERNIPFHKDLPLLEIGRPVRSLQIIVYEAFLQAEQFHENKVLNTSHARQLQIAVEKSGPNRDEILDWAKLFAEQHNLNLAITRNSRYCSNAFFKMLNKIKRALYVFSICGDPRNPMQNVAEASLVAAAIRDIRPPIYFRLVSHIRNRVNFAR